MKKIGNYLLLVVTVVICICSIPASAQDTIKRFHDSDNYFIRAGYSFPIEDKFEGGFAASAGTAVNLLKKLNLEVEAGIFLPESNFLPDESSDSIGAGDLSLLSFNLNLHYYCISADEFGIYIKAGAGFSFNSLSPISAYDELGFALEEELDNSIQFIFGLGMDYQLTGGIVLNLDARYCLNSADGIWTTRDETSGAEASGTSEADLNFIIVMLGVRFN